MVNVIKSCRVMLRTFPSTLHPPRHILMSLTAKYFQSQCLKTLSELCVLTVTVMNRCDSVVMSSCHTPTSAMSHTVTWKMSSHVSQSNSQI